MTEMDAPAKGPAVGVSGPATQGMPRDTALQTGGTNTFEVRRRCYGGLAVCVQDGARGKAFHFPWYVVLPDQQQEQK